MRRYDHILFDLDGTLADTPDFHCKVFIDYFTECGKVFDPDKITNGLQKTLSIRDVLRDAGVKDEEEEEEVFCYLRRFYGTGADDMIGRIRLADGARETLGALHKEGYGMALISNSMQELLERMVVVLGLQDYFFELEGAKEEQAEKLERFRALLERNEINPGRVLYVGDTNGDMKVAHTLGCDACFANTDIAWAQDKEAVIRTHKPEYVIGSIGELLEILA